MNRPIPKRKCLHCRGFFVPDYRNVGRQRYCSKPPCQQASKADSQRRWLQKPDNHDHFRGPDNVKRVQLWRQDHPGYWRRQTPKAAETSDALQETCTPQIDYHQSCQIKDLHAREGLKAAQIAGALGLDAKTVAYWLSQERFRPRHATPRASKLDPFKPQIRQMLEKYPYSAAQVWQRLREQGFAGGYAIVKAYVRTVRPRRQPAFLKLAFAPGECAQVDWGLCRARHRPHYADIRTMPNHCVVGALLLGARQHSRL
jgi:hypothetical protein